MGCFVVGGDPQDNRIEFLEFAIQVTESLGFPGSPRCVVLGIKVKDDDFSLHLRHSELRVSRRGKFEIRDFLSYLYLAHICSVELSDLVRSSPVP